MCNLPPIAKQAEIAQIFGVSTRTLHRWHKDGIDLLDPLDVATKIVSPKSTTDPKPLIQLMNSQTTEAAAMQALQNDSKLAARFDAEILPKTKGRNRKEAVKIIVAALEQKQAATLASQRAKATRSLAQTAAQKLKSLAGIKDKSKPAAAPANHLTNYNSLRTSNPSKARAYLQQHGASIQAAARRASTI
ncbi:MAG: hypothetical protein O3A82_17430 [Verrucomicrobia bacterium]|nr:hypothetical protein [Verrucomicrobiota bacterium]